jgi:NAD(P)-dependent dehydrogenase (short-subunit alcohol dehydrogenase family)
MATVLITGTSTGIGFATALAFGKAGHRVVATMRTPARAPELANLAGQDRLAITVYPMDVDLDASVSEAIGRIGGEHGPIDVLVNNAGIERMGSVEELRSPTSAPSWRPTTLEPFAAFRQFCQQCGNGAAAASSMWHPLAAHRHLTASRLLGVQVRGGGSE